MAQKQIVIPGIGPVLLQKRRANRSIRLTIGHDGTVRVSMPAWSPYKVGEAFALSKRDWIVRHSTSRQPLVIRPDDRIGKGHRLRFVHEQRPKIGSRVTPTEVIIRLPLNKEPGDSDVQAVVQAAAIRALKLEAKLLLPQRLAALAKQHDFTYHSVTIKQLKTRWGSCSSNKDIALNCFLMQLPWELIDYVILHELVHTRILAHGQPFWDELGTYVSDIKTKRKTIRSHQPTLLVMN